MTTASKIEFKKMTGETLCYEYSDKSLIEISKWYMDLSKLSLYEFDIFKLGVEEPLNIDEVLKKDTQYFIMDYDELNEDKIYKIKNKFVLSNFLRYDDRDDLLIDCFDRREIGDFTHQDLSKDYIQCKEFYEKFEKNDYEWLSDNLDMRNLLFAHLEDIDYGNEIEEDDNADLYLTTNLSDAIQTTIYEMMSDNDELLEFLESL